MKAHLIRGAFYLLLPLLVYAIPFALAQSTQQQSQDPPITTNASVAAPAAVCTQGWSAGPDMPSTGVRMVGLYFATNSKFYAVGGRSMDRVGNDFTHPFEYDPGSNSWIIKSATFPDNQVSNMACGVLTDLGTPYIYCVGGSAGGQTTATDRVFRYDPVTDSIESIASPWPGNSDGITPPGGFSVFNNKLYILGRFRINTAVTNQIWEFTPATNSWIVKNAVLPAPRGYIPTATYFNYIYTAGGSDWNGTTLVDTNDSFKYDPIADSIAIVPNTPRATGETRALKFAGLSRLVHQQSESWAVAGLHQTPLMKSIFFVQTPYGTWVRHSPPRDAISRPIPTSGTLASAPATFGWPAAMLATASPR